MNFLPKFQSNRTLAYLALVTVWVVWGSTYLGIRFAVETIPPLLMAGFRFLAAGVLMLVFAALRRATGTNRVTWRQLRSTAIVGVLLLVGGNGLLSIGAQVLDSGFAALLVATVPIWMVLMNRLATSAPISRSTVVALLLGTAGTAALIGLPSDRAHFGAALLVVFSSACWAAGSVYARSAPLPGHPMVAAALEMAIGGAALMLVGCATGELSRLRIAHISPHSIAGLLWLIAAGSILAFSAYVYANARLPNNTVATYAYVNPIVAVILGAVFGQEPITLNIMLGGAVIVCSVVLIIRPDRLGAVADKRAVAQPAGADS